MKTVMKTVMGPEDLLCNCFIIRGVYTKYVVPHSSGHSADARFWWNRRIHYSDNNAGKHNKYYGHMHLQYFVGHMHTYTCMTFSPICTDSDCITLVKDPLQRRYLNEYDNYNYVMFLCNAGMQEGSASCPPLFLFMFTLHSIMSHCSL